MNVSELFKRNLPVFLIAGVTVLLFVLIILVSQRQSPTNPAQLIEVEEEELIATHTYIQGPFDAEVTLVEFTDFGCPACRSFQPTLNSILEDYPNQIKFGIRHFPLPSHQNAYEAAIAAQAAGEQDMFWEYIDLLYQNQGQFKENDLIGYADFLGMDVDQFRQDYKNRTFENIVIEDMNFGKQIGVNSTPTFFLNGKQLRLSTVQDLRLEVENALEEAGENVNTAPEEATNPTDEASTEESGEEEVYARVRGFIEERYGVLEIEFTEEGFSPRNTQAYAGQLVIWTNNSEQDLTFEQLMPKFDELSEPFVIEAGETFQFRIPLREEGLYTYKQEGSNTRASIFINELPDSLKEMIPDFEQ